MFQLLACMSSCVQQHMYAMTFTDMQCSNYGLTHLHYAVVMVHMWRSSPLPGLHCIIYSSAAIAVDLHRCGVL